jgi:tetratricopeptide (TPR) repeat protein
MGWWAYLAALWWIYWGLLYRAFGNRLGMGGAYRRAAACFTRALAHTPEDARLYLWRGTLYWRELGSIRLAEEDLGRAIELAPEMGRPYLNRALARWYALPPDRASAAADFRSYLERADDAYWEAVAREHLAQFEDTVGREGATEDSAGL